jgi:hypothetical protein
MMCHRIERLIRKPLNASRALSVCPVRHDFDGSISLQSG